MMRRSAWSSGSWTWKSNACTEQETTRRRTQMDTPEPRLLRRLQRTLLAFFCLSALFLVVVYVAAPSIYTNTLLLALSPTEHYPTAAPLLLVGIGGFLA